MTRSQSVVDSLTTTAQVAGDMASSLDRSVAAIAVPEWVLCARQNLESVFVFRQISARGCVHTAHLIGSVIRCSCAVAFGLGQWD